MLIRGELPPELTRAHHAGAPVAELAGRVEAARRELARAGAAPEVVLQLESGRYADIEDHAGLVLARWKRFVAGDAAAWLNGLDVEENRRLFCATDRTEIAHLVFEGLRRIALRPEGELQLALYLGDIATVPKVDGYAVVVTRPKGVASATDPPVTDPGCSWYSLKLFDGAGYTGNYICFTGRGFVNLSNYCRTLSCGGTLCFCRGWDSAVRAYWSGSNTGWYSDIVNCPPADSMPAYEARSTVSSCVQGASYVTMNYSTF